MKMQIEAWKDDGQKEMEGGNGWMLASAASSCGVAIEAISLIKLMKNWFSVIW